MTKRLYSFMVAIALCVVFFVVAQALFFLVRAVKRAKELGIANQTIKNTIVSSSLLCHNSYISLEKCHALSKLLNRNTLVC